MNELLVAVLRLEILLLCATLLGLVGYRLLTGHISLSGLLSGETGRPSPARIQLLITTLVATSVYLVRVLDDPGSLPPISNVFYLLVGASQIIYVGGKAAALVTLRRQLRQG
jgi:hypothetical protein